MSDPSSPQPFPATRWSLIARARGDAGPDRRKALDELLRRYLPALRTHLLLSRRLDPDRADDLLQSFVADRFVEQSLLSGVGPEKGRFRTLLLRAMNNFLIDQLRREQAQKRGGSAQFVGEPDAALHSPSAGLDDPAVQYDLAWARQVIDQASALMRAQCAREDRVDIWEVFYGRVLAPTLQGAPPTPYEELVTRFHYETPEQAANVLITGKRSFQRALREVVADYCDAGAVADEIRDLRSIVARGGGGGGVGGGGGHTTSGRSGS
jgi:RNA polymerase sigma-70 factor (ECF subfamily)